MFNWLTNSNKDWIAEGNQLRAQGKYEEAISCYDKALENDKDKLYALSNKGRALYDIGDFAQAIICYDEALKLEPKDAYLLHSNKGLCLRALGRYKEAVISCRKAVELNPKHFIGWCSLGYVYYCLQRYDEAIKCYDTVLIEDDKNTTAWNYRANVLLCSNQIEQAWECNNLALQINANNPYALQTKAVLIMHRGQPQTVATLLEQAQQWLSKTDKSPTSKASLFTQRGQLYLSLRKLPEAKTAFKAALKVLPNYTIARLGLEQVKNSPFSSPVTSSGLATTSYPGVETTDIAKLLQHNTTSISSDSLGINLDDFSKNSVELTSHEIGDAAAQFADLSLTHTATNSTLSKQKAEKQPNSIFEELSKQKEADNSLLSSSLPASESKTAMLAKDKMATACLSEPALASNSSPLVATLSSNYIIPNNELNYEKKVGKGAFGEVFKGVWRREPVAIKRLLISNLSSDVEKDFIHEAGIMARMRSDYIVFLKGIVLDSQPYCLVMSWMPNGSLYEVLHSDTALPWTMRKRIAEDISKGLSFLHYENIIHRDVKSLNVLLDEHMRAKLSDFGLSKVKVETKSKTAYGQETAKGSIRWMAPELFGLRPRYSLKSDIYAYGMVVWELVTRKIPYEDVTSDAEIRDGVRGGEREDIPSRCPTAFEKLIKWCWGQEPNARPTADEIVDYFATVVLPEESVPLTSSTKQKLWQVDKAIRPDSRTMTISHQLLQPTEEDKQKIVAYYQQYPVPGCDIGRIQVIYSPAVDMEFEVRLKKLQKRTNKPAFVPTWQEKGTVEEKEWRTQLHKKFGQVAAPYVDNDYPDVKLVPLWHGTRMGVIKSILETGYANLGISDDGFFGRGVYSTFEAEYAYRLYSTKNYLHTDGVLLLNWVSSFSVYPVMNSDRASLKGKSNYANYDAHIIPVTSSEKDKPYAVDYWACQPNQRAQYTEFVVFESSQCLPRYVIELQPNLPRPVPMESEYAKIQKRNYSNFFKPEGVQFKEKNQASKPASPGWNK
jgi:serine/threonine protein kinase/tetratricopeptide (TPR) repeat protein